MINSWLTKTTTLAFLLLTFMALMLGFRIFTEATGGITLDTILDTIGPVSDAQALLASMSEAQKLAHFRLTLWLDMLFPLAYGGLFAGLTLRYFQTYGKWLVLPALLVIPVDITENIIQLLALSGSESLLGVKALLTPTKFILFQLSAGLALTSVLVAAARRRWRRQKSDKTEI
jgi:hypothetical protein